MDNGAVTTTAYDGAKSPILTHHDGSSEIFANLPTGANTTTYLYDLVGNIASVTEPNGVVTTYSYNKLNRLTDEVVKNAAGTTLASYSYTLDNAGNRTGVTETQLLPNGTVNTRTVAYTYDNLYRLLSETISGDSQGGNGTITYTYYLTGNRMSRTSNVAGVSTVTDTYNANDELTSEVSGGVTTNYSYDLNGNTTETSNGTTTTTFTYDSQNRLVKQDAGQSNEIDITYDGAGNKVSETVGGVTTKYLIDGNNPTGYGQIVEEIVNGAVTRRYTLGHWIISETQNISGAWAESFYGYDGHNSVRFLTNANGVVTDNYTFDAFGIRIAGNGTTPNQILYSGEYLDPGTGNYDLRARVYQQNTGTFLTRDTYAGQLPYVYTADNPVMFADPSGHDFAETLGVVDIGESLDLSLAPSLGRATSLAGQLTQDIASQEWARSLLAVLGAGVSSAALAIEVKLATEGIQDQIPTFYVYQSRTPDIYINDWNAITNHGAPDYLEYVLGIQLLNRPMARKTPRWAAAVAIKGPFEQLDEYPFASTVQGGAKPWLTVAPVPAWENLLQGTDLLDFYNANGFIAEKFGFFVVALEGGD